MDLAILIMANECGIAVWYCGPTQFKKTLCAVGGKTPQGKALYLKAKAIYSA